MSEKQAIIIKEANEHNLQSISLEIPHNTLTVITGVSGSGKSSLAYDIVFKEGQKRYLETFSGYARQYLGKLSRANVGHISGLRPALAVDQKSVIKNPRSTVGTMSEIYDYLRLLYSTFGEKYCAQCGHHIAPQNENELFRYVYEKYENKKIQLLAPIIEGHKGEYKKILHEAVQYGFTAVRIDNILYPVNELPEIDKNKIHNIEYAFKEIDLSANNKSLFKKEFTECLKFGTGKIKILENKLCHRYTLSDSCSSCHAILPEYGPRLFSFNSNYGACPVCKGLGVEDEIAEDLLVEDRSKSIRQGALVITAPNGYIIYSQVTMDVMSQVCKHHGFTIDIPWKELTPDQKKIVLYGSNEIKIPFGKHSLESRMKWSGITAKPREEGFYKGIIPVMEEILKRDRNPNILRFARTISCKSCGGNRLRKEAYSVIINQKNIADAASLSLDELNAFLSVVQNEKPNSVLLNTTVSAIQKRIQILQSLGLGYLSLDRESTSLSGGEAQRIRLATQAVSGLRGMIYVLDEPSIGLHPKDSEKLIEVLKSLRDNGNTIIVVEHDEDIIRSADYIIDIGPGAGINGGKLLFAGALNNFLETKSGISESLTYRYLSEKKSIQYRTTKKLHDRFIRISNASKNNLKDININIQKAALNVVTGVSGSGKKSLVKDVIAKNIVLLKKSSSAKAQNCSSISGLEEITNIIKIDQAPIGKTPRSNPATYTNLFDHIRDLFAALPESKEKKWKKGRFSFNVKGGRCEECQGAGVKQIGMHFLGNVDIPCENCGGMRFNSETLSVLYKGKSIYEILELSVAEAILFFKDHPKISRILNSLTDLGLGYIKLGQPSTTLSGGEAQRIRLAAELSKKNSGNTLYLLEEPTTGLHFFDVEILLKALRKIVDSGNTVIAIEHHIGFIKSSDWLIELGPGSGKNGGNLIFEGLPKDAINNKKSVIAPYLNVKQKQKALPSSKVDFTRPIKISGANTHNLKNINVVIPPNKLTVITGVSGSGKSSLAFDTIFAESQQRYLENLSTFSRRFIKKLQKADIDNASGLSPAIAINQKNSFNNPRSTLGTITEIYDYYRLLYSRVGISEKSNQQLSAQNFSFNYHTGACSSCKGLGVQTVCDPEKIIAHPEKSILNGAMSGTKTGSFYGDPYGQYVATLKTIGHKKRINFSLPWIELKKEAREIALFGSGDEIFDVNWEFKRKERSGTHNFKAKWPGITFHVNEEYERKHADNRGEGMLNVMKFISCPACNGQRLNKDVLNVRFAKMNIAELSSLTVTESLSLFEKIKSNPTHYNISKQAILTITDIVYELEKRFKLLNQLGLGYLSVDRNAQSFSGGESQRIRLASLVGSELTGITFIFDEPTIGLHSRDTKNLSEILLQLRDIGNTVILVEHDRDIIQLADHIIDLGPGAGNQGGEIVAEGSLSTILRNKNSITGQYLSGKKKIEIEKQSPEIAGYFKITEASANNLKNINLNIPLSGLVVVTGVSGSGKSSLLFDVIEKSAKAEKPVNCESVDSFDHFKNIISSNQSAIGSNPMSTPVTYLGVFDEIRSLFANSGHAKSAGLKKAAFSFNSKEGRCDSCKGMGNIKVSMDFLNDIWSECEDCKGKRFKNTVLKVLYKTKSISEILHLTVTEAKLFFAENIKLNRAFSLLEDIGLGYIQLGQASNTLSGGESQRLKLARNLLESNHEKNLYLIDEPTTGLHFNDIEKLLKLFNRLVMQGHCLMVIEHNPDIIKHADWIIDLGPEGGNNGGNVVFQGLFNDLLKCKESYTAEYLCS